MLSKTQLPTIPVLPAVKIDIVSVSFLTRLHPLPADAEEGDVSESVKITSYKIKQQAREKPPDATTSDIPDRLYLHCKI
jgi:hypothetical protein